MQKMIHSWTLGTNESYKEHVAVASKIILSLKEGYKTRKIHNLNNYTSYKSNAWLTPTQEKLNYSWA